MTSARSVAVAAGLVALMAASTDSLAQTPSGDRPAKVQPQPPVVKDLSVVSLHRARPDWDVTTSFCIAAEDPDSPVPTFNVLNGAAHGHVDCKKPCTLGPNDPKKTADTRSTRCEYRPALGYTGPDSFTVQAVDATGLPGQAATISIDVRNEGLRWELVTANSTGLDSDRNQVTDIPKVIGKNLQDFLFVLNWQTASARQDAVRTAADRPVIGIGKLSRNLNVVFQTGLQSGSATVDVEPVAAAQVPGSPTTPSGTVPQTSAQGKVAANQRQFTAGGQVNANLVFDADEQGTFVELGLTGKAAVDVFLDGAAAQETSPGKFVQLLREGNTFFRGEAGLRVGIKQLTERSTTVRVCHGSSGKECSELAADGVVRSDEKLLYPANLEELVYVELLYQRNNALAGLSAGGADSRNRLAVRIAAQPVIASLPGRPKFLIGVEVSRAFSGGPPITRIFYGLNLSGNKLF